MNCQGAWNGGHAGEVGRKAEVPLSELVEQSSCAYCFKEHFRELFSHIWLLCPYQPHRVL